MSKYPRLDNYWDRSARMSIPIKLYCAARDELFRKYRLGEIKKAEFYQRMKTEARDSIRAQRGLAEILVPTIKVILPTDVFEDD